MRGETVVLENNTATAVGKRWKAAEHFKVHGLLDDFLAGEKFEQGGFAAARGADQRYELAAAHDKVNIIEHSSHAADGRIEITMIGVLQVEGLVAGDGWFWLWNKLHDFSVSLRFFHTT